MTDKSSDILTEDWLVTLVEHDLSIGHAAQHLERRLPAGPARAAVAEVAQCARRSADTLAALLASPQEQWLRRGFALDWAVRVAALLSRRAALRMLGALLRMQDRRFLKALDVVGDTKAQYAIMRWARPSHMRALTALRQANLHAAASGLKASS